MTARARITEYLTIAEYLTTASAVTLPHGQRVVVWKNLTAPALLRLLSASRSRHLRGLIIGRDIVWWDAHDAIHGDIAHVLAAGEYVDNRLDLRFRNDEPCVEADQHVWTVEKMQAHPQWRRMLASPLLYFYAGSAGWLSGPEFVAEHTSAVTAAALPAYSDRDLEALEKRAAENGVKLVLAHGKVRNSIYLDFIERKTGGPGSGATVMAMLCDFADQRGLRVYTYVAMYEPKLLDFYEDFGFVEDPRGGDEAAMVRLPIKCNKTRTRR